MPCILTAGQFPLHYAGITARTAMYDAEEMKRAWRLFQRDFPSDTCAAPTFDISPGRANEIMQNLTMKWPGHGLAEDAEMRQYVEGEYMMADEYDHMLSDPGDFFLRVYLPRTLEALAPLRKLTPFRHTLGMSSMVLAAAAQPDVRDAFQAIVDAGKEYAIFQQAGAEIAREGQAAGFPLHVGGMAHAPFDALGDTLRGTHGIMADIHRRPEKLLAAMEAITPWTIEGGVSGVMLPAGRWCLWHCTKGMTPSSPTRISNFYWPTLKKVILGLVAEGCVPMLFAEGKMNRRLEAIKDLPKSSVLWWFDSTDMARAKRILGDVACIAGNVPVSLMCLGTPQEVKDYCRKLIEDCGPGGGYILTGGASVHNTTAAHLYAMTDAVSEFGVY